MADSIGQVSASERETKGLVFDIKRFAVHDGPGVRTVVFLKGCGLSCEWCHNPESLRPRPELALYPQRCIACGACAEACPRGVHTFAPEGKHQLRRELCDHCGRCVEACYAEALVMIGRELTVGQVADIVLEDRAFYDESGGGVTLSGGEPFVQPAFTLALLTVCKANGIHTAVDTSGHVPWPVIEAALPAIDLVLYDLKVVDSGAHRAHTGADNARLLANLRALDAQRVPIEVRMPIVPGVNDTPAAIEAAGELLATLPSVVALRLLGYHRLAGSKYESIGLPNRMPAVESPSREHLEALAAAILRHRDLPISIGV